MKACVNVTLERGFFSYKQPSLDDPTKHWHMNFADPYLFGYGEGSLLAQDELQIVEHPILASLARAIEHGKHGVSGLKRETQRPTQVLCATPVLVQGAPRRCHLNTTNLYGDYFNHASKETVEAAVTPITPPTLSNILAIAAIEAEDGAYTSKQIEELYHTAYVGFRAVVLTSTHATLHTGHWGCGAFGGNKGLVAAIQILAAGAAGIEQLVYWYGHTTMDRTAVEHGLEMASFLEGKGVDEAIGLLESAGYQWGDANENHVPYQPPHNDLLRRSDEL